VLSNRSTVMSVEFPDLLDESGVRSALGAVGKLFAKSSLQRLQVQIRNFHDQYLSAEAAGGFLPKLPSGLRRVSVGNIAMTKMW
jgi:hypothetical protein